MAQIIRLKRSTSSGTKPRVDDLQTGEIAINVYDGKAFTRKSGSVDEVVEFVSTNTQTAITGDINLNGSVTASYFVGDGSQLTNITVDQAATIKKSFINQSTWVVTHNLNTVNPIAQVYDNSDYQMIPQTLRITDSNTITVTFESPESGYVVVAKGGHVVSGSIDATAIDGLNQAIVDGINAEGVISGSSQIVMGGDVSGTADNVVIGTLDGGGI